ncbi:cell division initiation protein [Streptomyces sp. LP05-1]|uniref:Cell division initiation protein n=1 Tax=Streptomyces pyxinae TaxID=2970734 RepID=A0ABT2CGR0_9ACTN|nr:cell division initiation protein [Streptomyces sp. LP05-1]MCS0636597.1 cell division initiation protein [Streptomyces sp. LP05-1]
MDVQKKLDEIVSTVRGARSMPMSASCVVNRAELLALLDEMGRALPGALARAEEVIGGSEQLLDEARREAGRIIAAAHSERGSLISDTQVARQSREEADRILADARREAEEVRAEADEYVDSKLANFEVVLTKTIGSVDRGREKLLGRGPGLDAQGYADEDAPEYSADPRELIQRADSYVDAKLGAFEAVLSKTLEAVGRGRQKLHGRIATDELGAHLAAQDAAGASRAHTSDADYLAGLAEPAAATGSPSLSSPSAPPAPAEPAHAPDPDPGTYGHPALPAQPPAPAQEAYAYQQDPYAYPAQEYGQGYPQSHDPYGYAQQPHQPQSQPHSQTPSDQGARQQQPGALDETSFFDTSMIDLDQLRRYEQGRG